MCLCHGNFVCSFITMPSAQSHQASSWGKLGGRTRSSFVFEPSTEQIRTCLQCMPMRQCSEPVDPSAPGRVVSILDPCPADDAPARPLSAPTATSPRDACTEALRISRVASASPSSPTFSAAAAADDADADAANIHTPASPPASPLPLQLVTADSGCWSDLEVGSPAAVWDAAEAWLAEGRASGLLQPRSPTPDSCTPLFGLGPISPPLRRDDPSAGESAPPAAAALGAAVEEPALEQRRAGRGKGPRRRGRSGGLMASATALPPSFKGRTPLKRRAPSPDSPAPAGDKSGATSMSTNDDVTPPVVVSARTKHRRRKPPTAPAPPAPPPPRASGGASKRTRPMPPIKEDEPSSDEEDNGNES